MNMIQPLLVPRNGCSADFVVFPCPDRPDHVQVWWGTALLHTVPRDASDPVTRGLIALLALAKYRREQIAACFGICVKTVSRIMGEVKTGCLRLLGEKSGIPDAIVQYLSVRYRDLREANAGKHDHGSFEKLRQEVLHLWNLPLSHEYVRVLLQDCRDQGETAVGGNRSAKEGPATKKPVGGETALQENPAAVPVEEVRAAGKEQMLNSPVIPDGDDGLSPAGETAAPGEPAAVSQSSEMSASPAADGTAGGISDSEPPSGNPPDFYPGGGLPEDRPTPLDHAGHLVIAPWFEQVFDGLDPILRQTGVQVLQGAVNQEGARGLNCSDLVPLVGPMRRDPAYQRRLLDGLPDGKTRETVIKRNIAELKPEIGPLPVFFYDPHPEAYTGDRKIIRSWNGALKRVEPSLLHDFVHTAGGCPVMAGLSDGFYEPRERFFMVREKLLPLLPEEARTGVTWVQDRGFWGEDFLRSIAALGDFFVQWEKGWEKMDETVPVIAQGTHTIIRYRNHPGDKVCVRLRWQVQEWRTDEFPGGRRIIVTLEKGKTVAIVTNAAHLAEAAVIDVMFGRWNQEGDLAMENRHFGINQLTSRRFLPYEAVAENLTDRQVRSRQAKQLENSLRDARARLGGMLIKLYGLPPLTLEKVREQRMRLEMEIGEIKTRMAAVPETPDPEEHGGIIREAAAAVKNLARRFRMNERNKRQAGAYEAKRALAEELKQRCLELKTKLAETEKTESKILVMIEEKYTTPDLRRKRLVDAVRISCRNIFDRTVSLLRPIYRNHRDDHETLRALIRAPGWAVRKGRGLEVILRPKLTREPGEWRKIRAFLDLCEQRFLDQFHARIRFMIQLTDGQILDFLTRNSRQDRNR